MPTAEKRRCQLPRADPFGVLSFQVAIGTYLFQKMRSTGNAADILVATAADDPICSPHAPGRAVYACLVDHCCPRRVRQHLYAWLWFC
jgi:hypothetical protein